MQQGERGQGQSSKARIEVRVKINTPDLSWTEFHPNCRADTHSILMHPRPPQNTHSRYYNSTLCDSPRLIERVWKIAPREELQVYHNVWRDDNAWKGINLKILLLIHLLQKICNVAPYAVNGRMKCRCKHADPSCKVVGAIMNKMEETRILSVAITTEVIWVRWQSADNKGGH